MVLLANAVAAWVDEAYPDHHYKSRKLFVKANSPNQRYAYIFFARPFPLGATILSAKLRVYNGSTLESGATLTMQRVKSRWSASRVTWATQPDVYATTYQVTKAGNIPPGTQWEIDVTGILQHIADGAPWYGFRITVNDGLGEWFYSPKGKEDYRPQLEITWTDKPEPPSDLSPGGGRAVAEPTPVLKFDYEDGTDESPLTSLQVQISSSTDFSGTLLFDSGSVDAEDPEFDTQGTTWTGATSALVYWRARVKNAAGKWSDYSDPESFHYVPLSAITLNNPPDVASPYVEDSTPPIFWSFSGTQTKYQVILAPANKRGKWLWTSGKITGTTTTVTPTKKVLTRDDATYNVRVRVWDNVDREATTRTRPYAQADRDFVFNYDPTTDPVVNLAGASDWPWPWVKLTWDRANAPDKFEIWRDGEIIDIIDNAQDAFVSGTSYQYQDRLARPRTPQEYKVVAKINGKASKNNPSVTVTPRTISRWLMDEDGTTPICMMNVELDMTREDTSEVHKTLGSGPPILISAPAMGWYQGTVTGLLVDGVVPISADTMAKRFETMAEEKGQTLILVNVNQSLRVSIYDPVIIPMGAPENKTKYAVSFSYIQVER